VGRAASAAAIGSVVFVAVLGLPQAANATPPAMVAAKNVRRLTVVPAVG